MRLLRSDRFPALVLLAAAAVGLIVANSPVWPAVAEVIYRPIRIIPGLVDWSAEHWIKDGLLTIFFFVVAIELRFELLSGQLRSVRRAVQPAIAAAGGVLVPIVLFLAIAGGTDSAPGWPVPTATDVAFALGLLAVFGRGMPSALRVFLLALAILDDIVGIALIAVLYSTDVDASLLLLALFPLGAFGLMSGGITARNRVPMVTMMTVTAIATWVAVLAAGVHPTIAGVALGLVLRQDAGLRVRYVLEPWVNGVILPLFAFTASLVVIPAVGPSQLHPVFWGVLVALPVGKLVGITVFGWLSMRIGRARDLPPPLPFADLITAGALGGVGFTVSLLLAQLAFPSLLTLRDEAILGVLAGSAISLVFAAVMVSARARHYRRMTRTEAA